MRGWIVLVLLAGCSDDDAPPPESCAGFDYIPYTRPIALNDLPEFHPQVRIEYGASHVVLGGSRNLEAFVHWGPAVMRDEAVPLHDNDEAYCPIFDDSLTASLDGTPGALDSHGGWVCLGPAGAVCNAPTFTFDVTDESTQSAHLEIADADGSTMLDLGDVLAPRSIEPVTPADWSFPASRAATVRWSRAADLAALTSVHAYFATSGTPDTLDGVETSGDTITFDAPAQTGDGRIGVELSGTIEHADFTLTASEIALHDVTITP